MSEPVPSLPARDPAEFERHRDRLMALAYRFLGSVSDAEDVVQESFLRWRRADRAAVANVEAFLVRTATRLCLDHLKSARVRRESYVGIWLPEPWVEPDEAGAASPAAAVELADDVSIALLLVLERLSPLERAAFLLHEAFGHSYAELALTLERSEAACRQLVARARQHVRGSRARYAVSAAEQAALETAFLAAVREGDVTAFAQRLAPTAVYLSDGGGRVPAALRPIVGPERIARLFAALFRRKGPPEYMRRVRVNGRPGWVLRDRPGIWQTFTFDLVEGRIERIYVTRNPDKLRHLHLAIAGAAGPAGRGVQEPASG